MLQGSRFLYKVVARSPKRIQPFLNLLHGVVSSVQNNYNAVAFIVLDLSPTIAVWRDLYFFGTVCTGLLCLARWVS